MKALKKISVFAAAIALAFASMPNMEVKAASALASYSFDSLDGMNDTGLGTAPTIVSDPERGNVLKFAAGTADKFDSSSSDGQKGVRPIVVVNGTPSSLSIANPYAGGSSTSGAISFWVKSPDSSAAEVGAALVGFISAEKTNTHPDNRATGKDVDWSEKGAYIFGVTAAKSMDAPTVNFAGLYHNWAIYVNENVDFTANAAWHFVTVSFGNAKDNFKVYVDGAEVGGYADIGKRFNHGEMDTTNPANTMEPTLMEILCDATTTAYIGRTGTSPTVEGLMMDDLCFWDSSVDDATAQQMYQSAQAGSLTGSGSTGNAGSSAGSGTTTSVNGGTSGTSNKTNGGSTGGTGTSNLPQTGVVSTSVLVGLGVAAIGAGAVLMKKKEER